MMRRDDIRYLVLPLRIGSAAVTFHRVDVDSAHFRMMVTPSLLLRAFINIGLFDYNSAIAGDDFSC